MLPLLAALTVAVARADTLPIAAAMPPDTIAVTAEAVARDGGPPDGRDPLALLAPIRRFPRPERPSPTPGGDTTGRTAGQPPIEHGDLYYTRLAIHRWTGYAAVPLLVAQYIVGQQLDDGGSDDDGGDDDRRGDDDGGSRGTHQALAGGIAAVFAVNTVTGGWNLIESWKEPGRVRKAHSILMLLADAAFVATFATAPDDDGGSGTDTHRTLAIAGGGLAVTGFALMIPTLLGHD